MHKILTVINVLFKTAAKKYPFFFVLKTIRMVVTVAMPFIGLFITPLIVDEIVGNRDVNRFSLNVFIMLLIWLGFTMSLSS